MHQQHIDQSNQNSIICNYCGKLLNREYYFKCKKCLYTYCFIHKSKHLSCSSIFTN